MSLSLDLKKLKKYDVSSLNNLCEDIRKDIISAVEKLSARFPGKKIDIVFFEHDGYKDKYQFDKIKVCATEDVEAYKLKTNHHLDAPEYRYGNKYNDSFAYFISMGVAEALDNIGLTDKLAAK